jgi:glycosyltransferase involved in cell wall biosynthesis
MAAKKVLMACTNYWSSPFQLGNNHLARCFVRAGWTVGWISDPITPFHVFGGQIGDYVDRYKIYEKGGEHDLNKRLWFYVPGGLLSPNNKPLLRSAWVQRYWYRLTFPKVMDVIRAAGFLDVDILFLNSSTYDFLLNKIQYRKSVLRIADNSKGFSRFTQQMARAEKSMAREVDLVIYTAQGLKVYVEQLMTSNKMYLPNGVDYAHFQVVANGVRPEEYKSIPRPIVIYIGAMAEWFDFPLVKFLAAEMPNVSFVLIGPDYLSRAQNFFSGIPNIFLLGRKPYGEIPLYLSFANVGLIPFDVTRHSDLVNSINPIKLYEYFAAGLPVVSAEWDELKNLESPAILCKTPSDFIDGIKSVLMNPPSKLLLTDFARKHDWTQRFDLLMKNIALQK